MGMGEPMANERHVFDSLDRITDPGLRIGARHITVSTVARAGDQTSRPTDHPQVGLAVSFHAADDELRDDLVPPNRLYPLARLEAAIAGWRGRPTAAPRSSGR